MIEPGDENESDETNNWDDWLWWIEWQFNRADDLAALERWNQGLPKRGEAASEADNWGLLVLE